MSFNAQDHAVYKGYPDRAAVCRCFSSHRVWAVRFVSSLGLHSCVVCDSELTGCAARLRPCEGQRVFVAVALLSDVCYTATRRHKRQAHRAKR